MLYTQREGPRTLFELQCVTEIGKQLCAHLHRTRVAYEALGHQLGGGGRAAFRSQGPHSVVMTKALTAGECVLPGSTGGGLSSGALQGLADKRPQNQTSSHTQPHLHPQQRTRGELPDGPWVAKCYPEGFHVWSLLCACRIPTYSRSETTRPTFVPVILAQSPNDPNLKPNKLTILVCGYSRV